MFCMRTGACHFALGFGLRLFMYTARELREAALNGPIDF